MSSGDMADAHETARERDTMTEPQTKTEWLADIAVESHRTNELLAEIRDRLPERPTLYTLEGVAAEFGVDLDEPADITDEPPVGSQVTDMGGDVWERREDGWALWWPDRSGWIADLYGGALDPWPVVRVGDPLRPTTDADRERVGLPLRPGTCDGCGNPIPVARCVCATCDHDNSTKPAPADVEGAERSSEPDGDLNEVESPDPDEALAKALEAADERAATWLGMAREVRKHIDRNSPPDVTPLLEREREQQRVRAEKAEADLARVTEECYKWERLAHEQDDNAKRHCARAERAEGLHKALREDVAEYASDGVTAYAVRAILKDDTERAES